MCLYVFICIYFLFKLLELCINYYIYEVLVHINLIKKKKQQHQLLTLLCHYELAAEGANSSHALRSRFSLLFGKSSYEIPPQPANTSFVRSDKTRGISYFFQSHWVLCQVEAHRSLSPERVFPSDAPPPSQTHTLLLTHSQTNTPYNLLHTTNPLFSLLPHTSASVSWKETWEGVCMGLYIVCSACVCRGTMGLQYSWFYHIIQKHTLYKYPMSVYLETISLLLFHLPTNIHVLSQFPLAFVLKATFHFHLMISFSEFICSFTSTGPGKYQQHDRVNCLKVNLIWKVNKYLVTSSGWCKHSQLCKPQETESFFKGHCKKVCASKNTEKVHYSFSLVSWKWHPILANAKGITNTQKYPVKKQLFYLWYFIYLHTHTLKYSILTFTILRYSEYKYPEIHIYYHICAR